MTKLIIVGTIEAVAGKRDELVATLLAHRERCFRDEDGVELFDIMTSNEDDTKIFVHEIYRDTAAFDAHFVGESFKIWKEETATLVVGLSVSKATPVE